MVHSNRWLATTLLALVLTLPCISSALSIEGTVDPATNCTVQDKSGVQHSFPQIGSPSGLLAVCVLAKALDAGVVSSAQLGEFTGFGLFVEGLNGVVAGGDEYWALWKNGGFADCGIECLPIAEGDTVSFVLTSFGGEERGSSVILHIGPTSSVKSASSGGGGEFLQARPFNVKAALDFLTAQQNPNGSFASSMLTDWAAIAFGAGNDTVCDETCRGARERLRAYISGTSVPETSTELERHIMALEALGVDPYTASGAPVDALVGKFDGSQMGDPALVNDDIFAIFPLVHAGYPSTDPMIDRIISFILSKQKINGSWEDSVDLTAAAIQALCFAPAHSGTSAALENAEQYIRRNQDDSGIFGPRSFTLSWVMQAIAVLGQTQDVWSKSGMTPLGYLGVLQQEDGGVEPMSVGSENRIWATSYAIPAALGKTWDAMLSTFSKPVEPLEIGVVAGTSTAAVELAITPPPTPRKIQTNNSKLSATPVVIPPPTPMITTINPTTAAENKVAAAANTQKDIDNFSLALWVAGLGIIVGLFAYVYLRKWVESIVD